MLKLHSIQKVNVLFTTLCIIGVLGFIGCISPTTIYTGHWEEIEHPPESGNMETVCIKGGSECVVAGELAVDIPDYIVDLLE